jgi:Uma2 family endonuclease
VLDRLSSTSANPGARPGAGRDGRAHRPLWHRQFDASALYYPTAAVVVEIRSPGDETYDKLPFDAALGIDEVLMIDPDERRVHVLALRGDGYEVTGRLDALDVEAQDLATAIRWP